MFTNIKNKNPQIDVLPTLKTKNSQILTYPKSIQTPRPNRPTQGIRFIIHPSLCHRKPTPNATLSRIQMPQKHQNHNHANQQHQKQRLTFQECSINNTVAAGAPEGLPPIPFAHHVCRRRRRRHQNLVTHRAWNIERWRFWRIFCRKSFITDKFYQNYA